MGDAAEEDIPGCTRGNGVAAVTANDVDCNHSIHEVAAHTYGEMDTEYNHGGEGHAGEVDAYPCAWEVALPHAYACRVGYACAHMGRQLVVAS